MTSTGTNAHGFDILLRYHSIVDANFRRAGAHPSLTTGFGLASLATSLKAGAHPSLTRDSASRHPCPPAAGFAKAIKKLRSSEA